MKTTCDSCQTRYEIPDDRAIGKTLRVRCKRCGFVMKVVGPTQGFDPDVQQRPPTLTNVRPYRDRDCLPSFGQEDEACWWIGIDRAPHGPYRRSELKALVTLGDVHARTWVWRSGFPTWQRVCEAPSLAFLYEWVLEGAYVDANADDPFEVAGMVSDGKSYFPDPTLKSGWLILDERTQAYLETIGHQDIAPSSPKAPAVVQLAYATLCAAMVVGAAGTAWLSYLSTTIT